MSGVCINRPFTLFLVLTTFVILTTFISYMRPSTNRNLRTVTIDAVNSELKILNALVNPCISEKPNEIKYRHQYWQVLTHEKKETILLNAFYDNRNVLKNGPVVRLFGVSDWNIHHEEFCHIWFANISSPYIVAAEKESVGRGLFHLKSTYMEYMYTCPIAFQSVLPTHISLSWGMCNSSSTLLKVQFPRTDDHKEFGMCVAAAYGRVHPTKLVHWIEFNRLLGISEITVYNSTLSHDSLKVFSHYHKEGIVDLRQGPPPLESYAKWPSKLATIPILNDCMYRNMLRYKWMFVIDFDELIIPRMDDNYHSLFHSLQVTHYQSDNIPAFLFTNVHFFLDFPPDDTKPLALESMRYRSHTEPSPTGHACKSVTNPRRCMVLSNHLCLTRTPDVGQYWTRVVDLQLARSHHYKYCSNCYDADSCKDKMKSPEKDDTVLRFEKQLKKNVDLQLKYINKHSKS